MKNRSYLTLAAVALLCARAAQAQADSGALTLEERITATFRATDLDKNGTISPREAAKAGIPAKAFALHDKNKDRRMGSDEFRDYYQQLIADSRAERARRAEEEAKRKAEEEAKRKQAEADASRKQGDPAADPAKPADGPVAKPADRPAVDPGKPVPVAGGPDAKPAAAPGEADAKPADASGVRPEGATPAKRVQGKVQPRDPKPSEQKPTPVADGPKPNEGTEDNAGRQDPEMLKKEQRARGHVQRLLAGGQLSAADGREIYKSLGEVILLGQDGKPDAKAAQESIVAWRGALNHAKDRVTALVRSGALSAEEGREIYDVFEVRARGAAQKLVEIVEAENAAKGEPAKPVLPAEGVKPADGKPVEGRPLSKEEAAKEAERKAAEQKAQDAHNQERAQQARENLRKAQAEEAAKKAELERQRQNGEKQDLDGRKGAQPVRGETAKPGEKPAPRAGEVKPTPAPKERGAEPVPAPKAGDAGPKPAGKPAEAPAKTPAETPAVRPAGKPVSEPAKPAEKPTVQPADKPAPKPAEVSTPAGDRKPATGRTKDSTLP
ncbi:MAG: hypothetical protein R3F33_05615 [Planctomycetota bacterium]